MEQKNRERKTRNRPVISSKALKKLSLEEKLAIFSRLVEQGALNKISLLVGFAVVLRHGRITVEEVSSASGGRIVHLAQFTAQSYPGKEFEQFFWIKLPPFIVSPSEEEMTRNSLSWLPTGTGEVILKMEVSARTPKRIKKSLDRFIKVANYFLLNYCGKFPREVLKMG